MDDVNSSYILNNIILFLNWNEVFNPFQQFFIFGFITIFVLLILTALMCALEVAIFSFNDEEIKNFQKNGDETDNLILKFIEKPRRFLATFVLSTTLFTLSIVLIFESILEQWLQPHFIESHHIWIYTIKIAFETFIIVLFAEVIPKIYATQYYYKVARFVIHPINFLDKLFSPFVKILILSSNFFEKRLEATSKSVSAQDIDEAIDITASKENGNRDTKILKGIVKFGNISVTQIMQSRVDVVAIDKDWSFKKLLETVSESGYSRIPVYDDNLDKIVGIIYAKDLLKYLESPKDFDWNFLIKPAFYVPESKKIDDLLEEFQHKRIHMAVVVDEYGGSSGIVTLEDVLEEVIGEIKDEFDDLHEIDYKKLDNYNYIFEAKIALNDVCKVLDISTETFKEIEEEPDSLAGLILELNSEIPKEGDEIKYKNFTFLILEADITRIIRVKITLKN